MNGSKLQRKDEKHGHCLLKSLYMQDGGPDLSTRGIRRANSLLGVFGQQAIANNGENFHQPTVIYAMKQGPVRLLNLRHMH